MKKPEYIPGNTFIPQLIRTLGYTYDFRDIRDINKTIGNKAIYNQAINIWNELNNPENM